MPAVTEAYPKQNDNKTYEHCKQHVIMMYNEIRSLLKFASLTMIEPGLGRKLTQPLIEIISRF